ncbi:coiled coil protein [Legionella jordanis]|uniref:Coiled coil protein n=3 Tax=Legionella jordanis TaxID=456 RepID=A0A0W0VFQ9_9GAMM|nr:coiled coil protein [Legionella jordanis]RMX19194.1 hypothetical protein EAS68_07090 [Legionella jordanis]VEH13027.1 coiled coil protein [Legionella jordanis]
MLQSLSLVFVSVYMFKILDKFTGVVLGFILFPLKSLLINLVIMAFVLLTVVLALGFTPFILLAKFRSDNLLMTLLKTAMASLGAFVLIPTVAFFGFVFLVNQSITDVFKSIYSGVTEGYRLGFRHILEQTYRGYDRFSPILRAIHGRAGGRFTRRGWGLHELTSLIADDTDYTQLEDVPRSANPVPDLTGESQQTSQSFIPLTDEELEKAKAIANEELEKAKPITKLKLKTVIEQYESLLGRLNKLEEALSHERDEDGCLDDELIEDELIVNVSIKNPSLIVKLVKDEKTDTWRVEPATTKIIDFEKNLYQWLQRSDSHPLISNESLREKPNSRWQVFKYVSKDSCLEIKQAASIVRKKLAKLAQKHTAENSGTPSTVPESEGMANTVSHPSSQQSIAGGTPFTIPESEDMANTTTHPSSQQSIAASTLAQTQSQLFFKPTEQSETGRTNNKADAKTSGELEPTGNNPYQSYSV